MKKYKKIYIEITNACNLSCSFCSVSNRVKQYMSIKQFNHIIEQIKPFTDYVYLHVKGEPLLHPQLNEFLEICNNNNIKVNITTNGTLFPKLVSMLKKFTCIYQINFSLHSENNYPYYCENIWQAVEQLPREIIVVYRLWTNKNGKLNKKSTEIVERMRNYYNLPPEIVEKIMTEDNIKIEKNRYVDKNDLFEWPIIKKQNCQESGYCQGLKTHLGILVDGTVVPCCLDGEGVISLGNIYETSFVDILNSHRSIKIREGFKNKKAVEELCQNCSYKERFNR